MPLSISNSEHKSQSWWLTWLLATVILVIVIGGYETYLVKRGFNPSVEVTRDLWSVNRKAVQNNSDAVVMLGASRIQLGLNTAVMQARLPDKDIVPLAINGQYPMATLKSLAEDQSFNGLVVMSFMAQMLEPQYVDMQQDYNQYFQQKSSVYLRLDAYLTAELKSRIRFLHPLLGLNEIVKNFSRKKVFPKPFYVSVNVDTSAVGDYSDVDTEKLKEYLITSKESNYQEFEVMDQATWQRQLQTLSNYVEAIQAKGGQVVLVRFPTDYEHWILDEKYYPRAAFWDVMVATLPQLKTIHFKDYDVLSSFELPDASHLDKTDTEAFTLHLIDLLEERQIIN